MLLVSPIFNRTALGFDAFPDMLWQSLFNVYDLNLANFIYRYYDPGVLWVRAEQFSCLVHQECVDVQVNENLGESIEL